MDLEMMARPIEDVIRSSLADTKAGSLTCSSHVVHTDVPALFCRPVKLVEEDRLGPGPFTPPRDKVLTTILQQYPLDVGDMFKMDSHANQEKIISHGNDAPAHALFLPNACNTMCDASLKMNAPPVNACKYFGSKGGCWDGLNCSSFPLWHWHQNSAEISLMLQHPDDIRRDGPIEGCSTLMEFGDDFSIGSIGHPYTCALACKYHSKKAGCKEGRSCTRCHSCRWTKCAEKKRIGSAPIPKMPNTIAGSKGAHAGELAYKATQTDASVGYAAARTCSSISSSGVSVGSSLEKDMMMA